jgi:signal transduction histidine kinase
VNLNDIFASSVHDIKNALGMITYHLDQLLEDPANQIGNTEKADLLRRETERAQHNLVQLLTLYKMDKEMLHLVIDEHNLEDFFSDIIAENQPTCQAMGIDLSYRCDPMLDGYFDQDLLRGLINSTLGNAQRYAKGRILLSAEENAEAAVVIRIEDDGDGYPNSMLELFPATSEQISEAFTNGRTQLGLYFADQVARLHKAGDRHGEIRLSNGHELPGSCFELHLP